LFDLYSKGNQTWLEVNSGSKLRTSYPPPDRVDESASPPPDQG
jgi:hypothetical protein